MFRPSLFLFFILSFLGFLNSGCTKIDTTGIGANLLPAVDNINTFDTTLTVIATNFDTASRTCAAIYPTQTHVFGYISDDPYFGTTIASLYAQLFPPYFPYQLPAPAANITLDSAILVLSYSFLYGDSVKPQKADVYEVTTPGFVTDTSTCSNQTHSSILLGSAIYSPQDLKDTVFGFQENSPNELRIKLSNSFGQLLLQQDSMTGFHSDTFFTQLFKGFAIVPDVSFGGNALTYYNIADTNTKLALYFKYTVNNTVDTTVLNFRLSTSSASANTILREHTGAEIVSHTNHPPEGDDVIYIQSSPGTTAEIKIPALTGFPNKIIHKAELIMEQVYSPLITDEYFTAPSFLFLDAKKADTSYEFIPCDFNISSGTPNLTSFGGFKTDAKDNDGNTIAKYVFDISRYVQKRVTNKDSNYVLRLSAPEFITNNTSYLDECNQPVSSPFDYFLNYLTFGRVKLGGGSNPDYRMRLHIIYSNL